MRVDITYTVHCCIADCDVTATEHFEQCPVLFGSTLPPPSVPRAWLEIGALLFCPKHVLLLHVDGHHLPLTAAE
jgi:hypothetical protein